MRIRGRWLEVHGGDWIPTCELLVHAAGGRVLKVDALIDTGADQTLLSAEIANALQLPMAPMTNRLFSVGSPIDVLLVGTTLQLATDEGSEVKFTGSFACCTDLAALDTCVLGRDILDHFAVIVDRSNDLILLLRDRHTYRLQPP